jgi:hypothetical protein
MAYWNCGMEATFEMMLISKPLRMTADVRASDQAATLGVWRTAWTTDNLGGSGGFDEVPDPEDRDGSSRSSTSVPPANFAPSFSRPANFVEVGESPVPAGRKMLAASFARSVN